MNKKPYMQPATKALAVELQQLMQTSPSFSVTSGVKTEGFADSREDNFWDDDLDD